MMPAIRVAWVNSVSEFTDLRDSWNSLLEHSNERSLFLAHEWLTSWLSTYGDGEDIEVLTLWRGPQLLAAAPFIKRWNRAGFIRISCLDFASSGISGHTAMIFDQREQGLPDQLMRALLARPDWHRLRLPDVPAGSRTELDVPLAARRVGFGVVEKPGRRSPVLNTAGTLSEFIAGLSANARSNLNRRWRRLAAAGPIQIDTYRGAECLGTPLQIAFEVSSRSWKAEAKMDMGGSEKSRRFFLRLFEATASAGWMSIWVLRLAEKPIAIQVHGTYQNTTHLLRTDFDKDYAHLAPGHNLLRRIIEVLFDSSVQAFDLGGQDYEYKRRLTDHVREHKTLELYNRTLSSRALYFARTLAARARRQQGSG